MATYRLHVRSDEFSYENELHATRVDNEDGWTVFWADDDVFMRIRDEHIVSLEHLVASPVGRTVSVRADVVYVDGRLVRFEVVAEHTDDGKVIGHGEVTRVVVDGERFLARAGG